MSDATLPLWLLICLFVALLVVVRLLARVGCTVTLLGLSTLRGSTARLACEQTREAAASATNPTTCVNHTDGWISARFTRERFSGLPLTLIAIFMVYILLIEGYLTVSVVDHSSLVRLDRHINIALAPLRNADLLHVASWLTHLGAVSTVAGLLCVIAVSLWVTHRRIFIPGLFVTVGGAEMLAYFSKYLIDRPRPDFLTFASATSPSFPSGHATGSMALYGFLAYILMRSCNNAALRFEIAYWTAVLVAMIAASRLLLSVHYTSDVAAGLFVGCFWLLVGLALTECLRERSFARCNVRR